MMHGVIKPLVDPLSERVIHLAGVDPSLGGEDLVPLLDRLDGARVVGLGEATHGDRESFQFKDRLIEAWS